jgi:transaldolase
MPPDLVKMLDDEGQGLWLDHLTRDLLATGTVARYIEELGVTGVAADVSILRDAISQGSAYDGAIQNKAEEGKSPGRSLFELSIEDVVSAADLLRGIWNRSGGVDGWVSAPTSPLLAHKAKGLLVAATDLFVRARRPNLLVQIPGTREGLFAVEEAISAGIPVHVTLLFSPEQYRAAADAYLRALERRLDAELDPEVGSVASLSVGRWAAASRDVRELRNHAGIAIGKNAYKAYRALLRSPRWQRLFKAGARPQRLVWGGPGGGDPGVSEILAAQALAAPFTVNAGSVRTLKAIAARCVAGVVAPVGHSYEKALERLAGVDVEVVAVRLQDDALRSLVKSWRDLLDAIASKAAIVGKAG